MIAISEHTRLMLLKWGVSNERIAIVHPALDPDLIARVEQKLPLRNEEYQDQDESLRLLTICRLVERKGVQTVLKALRMLRQEFPNLHYDIVGDGPFRNELEELVYELDLDDIVKFHGLISDTAREALLQMCDIFIMVPFESADGDIEGFGIVYLEAGLHGVAVAGSRSGGVIDAVQENQTGVLVHPQDIQGVANVIRYLAIDTSFRIHLGRKGRVWARNHFPIHCGKALVVALNGMGR